MFKAILFVAIGAMAAVVGAYAFNKSRSALKPTPVTANAPLSDRQAGPRGANSYDVGFTAIDRGSADGHTYRTGGQVFVQIGIRRDRTGASDGAVEICGNYPVEKRNKFYERNALWLQTAFLAFKDIRVPASFIQIEVQGDRMRDFVPLDKTTVRCLRAAVPWHDRYYNMDLRALSLTGPDIPKPR